MSRLRTGTILLALVTVLAVGAGPAAGATEEATAAPAGFKVYVNGRQLSTKALNLAGDTYIPTRAGRLTIAVSWVNALQGTGHKVIITSPGGSDRRVCSRGTSCTLVASKPLKNTQESSWSVQIYRGTRLLSEKALCLVGKA